MTGREERKAIAETKLAWIKEKIADGLTVRIQTVYRITEVSPKTYASFADIGLFKMDGSNLRMRRGKSWEIIDGCRLTAQ